MSRFRRSKKRSDSSETKETPGGPLFYISMIALLIIGTSNTLYLFDLWDDAARERAYNFVFGIICGIAFASLFIRNHLSVLVHELKHAVISGLAGNRFKGLKIGRESGHFKYAYSKESAHHNATISLAPYWLPIFTFPLFFFGYNDFVPFDSLVILVGIGYGADLCCGIRDIAPHQTDLTEIRGGFWISIFYLLLMHIVIFTFIVAWVYQGSLGLRYMFYGLWNTAMGFAVNFYNR